MRQPNAPRHGLVQGVKPCRALPSQAPDVQECDRLRESKARHGFVRAYNMRARTLNRTLPPDSASVLSRARHRECEVAPIAFQLARSNHKQQDSSWAAVQLRISPPVKVSREGARQLFAQSQLGLRTNHSNCGRIPRPK